MRSVGNFSFLGVPISRSFRGILFQSLGNSLHGRRHNGIGSAGEDYSSGSSEDLQELKKYSSNLSSKETSDSEKKLKDIKKIESVMRSANQREKYGSASGRNPVRNVNFQPLTAVNRNGLTKYDMDFFETSFWLKRLLLKMRDDKKFLEKTGLELGQPSKATQGLNLCFEITEEYKYDFSVPPPRNTHVRLIVAVTSLTKNRNQRHKLRIIAGDKYDPQTDTIKLLSKYDFELSKLGELDIKANMHILKNALMDMLNEAKNNPDEFNDIPLDMSKLENTSVDIDIPKEWKDMSLKIFTEINKLTDNAESADSDQKTVLDNADGVAEQCSDKP